MGGLSPGGSEFAITYPPIKSSNSNKGSIIKYRVIAHKTAFRFFEDKIGILGEVVEAIERKEK